MKKEKVSKLNRNTRYFLWTLVGLVLLAGLVIGATYTINQNGVFVDNNKSFARTADVVVCRGTSLVDDIIKSFQCDVVCKSTDSAIIQSQKINQSIYDVFLKGGGEVKLKCGDYNISGYIFPRSNVRILGSGSCTVLNLGGLDEIFRTNINDTINSEIGYMSFTQSNPLTLGVGIDYAGSGHSNIYIHNIDFGDINYKCFRISDSSSDGTKYHKEIKIENIICRNSSFSIGKCNNCKLKDSYFYGQSSSNNVLGEAGYGEQNQFVNDFELSGNYFENIYMTGSCFAINGNSSLVASNNVFKCNGSSLNVINDNIYQTYVKSISNTYYLIPSVDTGALRSDTKSNSSILLSDGDFFIGDGSTNNKRALQIQTPAIVSNAYIYRPSKSCISISPGTYGVSISDSKLIECATVTTADRWIYALGANDLSFDNIEFISLDGEAGAIIRLQNTNRSTITNMRFINISVSDPYQLDSGSANSTTYIDRYVYPDNLFSGLVCSSSINSPFNERQATNSSTKCTCSCGTWSFCVSK